MRKNVWVYFTVTNLFAMLNVMIFLPWAMGQSITQMRYALAYMGGYCAISLGSCLWHRYIYANS